jgi:hypothetical protein
MSWKSWLILWFVGSVAWIAAAIVVAKPSDASDYGVVLAWPISVLVVGVAVYFVVHWLRSGLRRPADTKR